MVRLTGTKTPSCRVRSKKPSRAWNEVVWRWASRRRELASTHSACNSDVVCMRSSSSRLKPLRRWAVGLTSRIWPVSGSKRNRASPASLNSASASPSSWGRQDGRTPACRPVVGCGRCQGQIVHGRHPPGPNVGVPTTRRGGSGPVQLLARDFQAGNHPRDPVPSAADGLWRPSSRAKKIPAAFCLEDAEGAIGRPPWRVPPLAALKYVDQNSELRYMSAGGRHLFAASKSEAELKGRLQRVSASGSRTRWPGDQYWPASFRTVAFVGVAAYNFARSKIDRATRNRERPPCRHVPRSRSRNRKPKPTGIPNPRV